MERSPRVQKKSAYHHGDLRRSLIHAALRLVQNRGASAVTLREVARMAGVSHQAPYRHFTDRTELLAAVAEEGFRSLHAELVEQTRKATDAPAALQTIGVTYVVFAVEHPGHFRVMYGAEAAACRENKPSLAAAADAVFTTLTQTIAEVQRDRPGGPDTLDYALTAWSVVHGLASLLVDGQLLDRRAYAGRSPRALAELVTITLRRGLQPLGR
jgi:AcrR family transcriptional regulator